MDEYLKELGKLVTQGAPVSSFVELYTKTFNSAPNSELTNQYCRSAGVAVEISAIEEADDSYEEDSYEEDSYEEIYDEDDSYSYSY